MARCTQSVGVPSTQITSGASWRTLNGASRVRELLAPLRLRSGATTVTVAKPLRASARQRKPSAWQPSSLLSSILTVFRRRNIQYLGYCKKTLKTLDILLPVRTAAIMASKFKVSEEDTRVFRDSVAGAKPLPPQSVHRGPRPKPRARFARAAVAEVLEESLPACRIRPNHCWATTCCTPSWVCKQHTAQTAPRPVQCRRGTGPAWPAQRGCAGGPSQIPAGSARQAYPLRAHHPRQGLPFRSARAGDETEDWTAGCASGMKSWPSTRHAR